MKSNMLKWRYHRSDTSIVYSSPQYLRHLTQHILNEYPVPRRGVADEDVGHGAHDLAVLTDGRARHECGQVGTTLFINSFVSLGIAS